MKRLLLAALLLGVTWMGRAQNVPEYVSFQGRVVDAQGNNLGSPNPVNRTVIFRIYDSPSSGGLKFTEQQNVTIINGEFSVLIGQGTVYASEPKPVLSTVCDGSERYLGVTVKDPSIALDANQKEIVPRQRFVTTPFAFRAKVAESVATGGIANGQIGTAQLAGTATVVNGVPTATTIAGAVTVEKLADNAVTSAKILDGQVMEVDLASNAVTSAKIKDGEIVAADLAGQDAVTAGNAQVVLGAVSTAKIQNGAVTLAKLGSDIQGFWSTNGATPADAYRATGKVGILTSTPVSTLTVGNGLIDSASSRSTLTLSGPSLAPENTSKPGFYHRSAVGLGIFSDAHMSFQVGGGGLIDAMFINSGGNVGIGTNTPQAKLDVQGSAKVSGTITSPMFRVTEVLPHQASVTPMSRATTYAAGGGTWLARIFHERRFVVAG